MPPAQGRRQWANAATLTERHGFFGCQVRARPLELARVPGVRGVAGARAVVAAPAAVAAVGVLPALLVARDRDRREGHHLPVPGLPGGGGGAEHVVAVRLR